MICFYYIEMIHVVARSWDGVAMAGIAATCVVCCVYKQIFEAAARAGPCCLINRLGRLSLYRRRNRRLIRAHRNRFQLSVRYERIKKQFIN